MRNPSSSDPEETPSEESSSEDQEEIDESNAHLGNKVAQKTNMKDVRDLKRPSAQFIDMKNFSDVESVIEEKGLMPINFGSEEKIQKNKFRKMSNKVRTTKYTWITWAPGSLLMQFKRAANIYFLIISILTLMPFSPKTPASMIGTFAFVLFVTMLKEALENYFRYKADKEANGRLCETYSHEQKEFVETKWKDIRVGDVIKIMKEDKFPVDMLLLVTPNTDGLVFIDTSNLDGETNLKDKAIIVPKLTDKRAVELQGKIFCDSPNHLLDEWDAELVCPKLKKNYICDVKNLLLRDTVLKNTDYCIGIAINLGKHTKIIMNSKKPKQKVSNIMKKMNYLLYSVFAFQLMIILTFATASVIWQDSNAKDFVYLDLSTTVGFGTWIIQLLTYWVTFSNMIPISLYVIIELLKLIQAYLINRDIELYHKENDQYGKCNNSDLIEELGQVEYIFSDKTGTLTMNKMVLKKCSILSKVYGELEGNEPELEGICESSIKAMRKTIRKNQNDPIAQSLRRFLIVLGVCHTVVCDRDEDGKDKVQYQSSSPDELALVNGAKDIGYELVARSSEEVTIYNKITSKLSFPEVNLYFYRY